jgi:2-aminoethylphosphonate-pyruvate transaminase
MDTQLFPDNPYLLLTPGPLSTTKTVKAVMLRDWCTWDNDYNQIVQAIRRSLVDLAAAGDDHTAVLMQGSGTFAVEATISTAVPPKGKLLVLANGAYGRRMALIAARIGINCVVHDTGEIDPPDLDRLAAELNRTPEITHVAAVHCETTTGMLNPAEAIGGIVKAAGRTYILDAMSSFGGIPIDLQAVGADYLISSANKCIQGVPGFGYVIARRSEIEKTEGRARSLSLDLFDQWRTMENGSGKWRFTSPTHTVRAFHQALVELEQEGGIAARNRRYHENHRLLIEGMTRLGFVPLLAPAHRSPIITAFYNPPQARYRFSRFYAALKQRGFVVYPGKVTDLDTFRIGTIGDIHPADIRRLVAAVGASMYWQGDTDRQPAGP